jgi:hypothetical protein
VVKKIVISPDNTKAIAFFEELSKKKAEIKKKLEERGVFKKLSTR